METTISDGMRSFMQVGAALAEIRKDRLYRAEYATFEEYCQRRWDFTAARGRQLMSAVEALASLPEDAPKPSNAAQAEALADVPEDDRANVWDRARRAADDEDRPVTARDIREAAEEPRAPEEPKTKGDREIERVEGLFRTALDSIKGACDAAESLTKSSAQAWLLTSGSALLKHLRDARDHVRTARPAGVCPACGGEGCRKCFDTGWVNRTRMDALKDK